MYISIHTKLLTVLITIKLLSPSSCSAKSLESQILDLKIKAITSFELSSMTFNELPSLFFLYENLVNKRFESISRNDMKKFDEFRKVHQYHAFKNSFYYSLKISDVMMIESFNAGDLDIIRNKVNWTDNEITSYEFLRKEKDVKKYQFWMKEFLFHEEAMADFFIAQYIYDNLVHPKDQPSDDEMELRLRLFLAAISDTYDRRPLTIEFIMGMIEDQNDEIFNDQVRMIMKYRFKYLLDRLLPDQLHFIEKLSKIFSKDPEILKNLWRVDDNRPYFLNFFRFTTSYDKVYKLKEIAEKFFTTEPDSNLTSNSTKLHAENIFRGKNQILNVLYRINEKKNEQFKKDILNVTKYEVSDEILTQMNQTKNFLDFVDSSSYSIIEKREFYYANSYNMISSGRNETGLMKFWKRLEQYFNNDELKWFITQKETGFNHTQLFLLPSHNDVSYVKAFFNLTKSYLNKDEIRDLLLQRHPISHESFFTIYIIIVNSAEILDLNYNFAKNHLSHEELKSIIFNNDTPGFVHKVSGSREIFTYCMDIVSEFYTKDEILDMLMTDDEYGNKITLSMVTSGNKYNLRNDAAEYLRKTFKDHQDKLKELLGARNSYGQTIFERFKDSYHKESIEPFLKLADEIFTAEEKEELYKAKDVEN